MQPTASCPDCPNSTFAITFRRNIGNEVAACPRWAEVTDRMRKKPPVEYVPVRRETCINLSPFEFCPSCVNSDPSQAPMAESGWWERVERLKNK